MTVLDFKQRPILNISDLCVSPSSLPRPLCFTLPGGLEICTPRTRLNLGVLEYAQMALGVANTAIAPLKPLFEIIDLITSMVEVLLAVPDVVTNPGKIVALLQKVEERLVAVAKLIPPFSILFLVLNLFDALIATIEGFAGELDALTLFSRQIEAAQFVSNKAPGLEELISCQKVSLRIQMENMQELFGSLNAILDVLNYIGRLSKLPGFPVALFGDSEAGTIGELPIEPHLAAAALRELVIRLQQIRALIPLS